MVEFNPEIIFGLLLLRVVVVVLVKLLTVVVELEAADADGVVLSNIVAGL